MSRVSCLEVSRLKFINIFYPLFIVITVAVEVQVDTGDVRLGEVTFADVQALVGVHFFHIQGPDRQCRVGALSQLGGTEVHAAVFSTDPHARGEVGGDAHEVTVAVFLRGSRLARNRIVEAVQGTQTDTRAALHYAFHQFNHLVSRQLAHGLRLLGAEALDDVAVFVFDAGDEHGLDVDTLVGEGAHGTDHLDEF